MLFDCPSDITGEEEEDVELELKGVKLYVKKGDKSFSDGMLGHIKLLSHRTTLDERICEFHLFIFYGTPQTLVSLPPFFLLIIFYLVFRREPLWKVSMNIRVQPTVRCSYVAEENVIRIVLKEVVEGTGNVGSSIESSSDSHAGSGDATHQEVVVYALKVRLIDSLSFSAA